MRFAFDYYYSKKVDAAKTGIYDAVAASSHRFICLYCDEWVALTRVGQVEQHFRHTKGDPEDCQKRAKNSSDLTRYYNPKNSFGLPIYLIGNKHMNLKMGFLQTQVGYAKLMDSRYGKSNFSREYNLQYATLNQYIYLNLEKRAETYYLEFNSKIYHGEGIADLNIFLEKTRRRIRIAEDKEDLYTNARYIMMIKENTDIFSKFADLLSNSEMFIEGNDLQFDFDNYKIFYFKIEKDNDSLIKILKKELKISILSGQIDVKFYWPLNTTFYEQKKLLYDNTICVYPINVLRLKTNNQKTIKCDKDEFYQFKLNTKDGLIGWNQESGCMYQLEVVNKLRYISFWPSIEFFDNNTDLIVDNKNFIGLKELIIRSNVKCEVLLFCDDIKNYKLEASPTDDFAILNLLIPPTTTGVYVLYNNKVIKKLERTIPIKKAVKIINYKKMIKFAAFDKFYVDIKPIVKKIISLIKNKQIIIILKNSITKGRISQKLLNYIEEVYNE